MSPAERDLDRLLAALEPRLRPGGYVFTRVAAPPAGVRPVVTVAEDEALTVVCAQDEADAAGLPYDYVAAWITLRVHSALDAVGLTHAVSGALAEAGLPCNVVAGYHHDHLFVPAAEGPRAVGLLRALADRAAAAAPGEAGR
ncbi:ACT domain-containing protein [Nocardiopsis mangrovi]|uniref:ACT domain-containing protein n=1 Tax=Nocardiopsis mangrovi TaxID=1179818 RepID=A0ABV9DWC9_9ACTN